MTIRLKCRNVGTATHRLATEIRKSYAANEAGDIVVDAPVVIVLDRPMERCPTPSLDSNPFDDLCRAGRVIATVGCRRSGDIYPPYRTALNDVLAAAKKLKTDGAFCASGSPYRRYQAGMSADISKRVHMLARFGPTLLARESIYSLALFESVLLEAISAAAEMEAGTLIIELGGLTARADVVDGLCDEWAEAKRHGQTSTGYETGDREVTRLVDPPVTRWAHEIEMIQSGALGIKSPTVRRVHSPARAARLHLEQIAHPDCFKLVSGIVARLPTGDWKSAFNAYIHHLTAHEGANATAE